MSGTVLDGEIDVALLETDGYEYVKPLRYMTFPYDEAVREKSGRVLVRRSRIPRQKKLKIL